LIDSAPRRSILRRHGLPAGGVLCLSWLVWFLWPGTETYLTCREVSGYYSEHLELSGGTFRYWTYSDAGDEAGRFPIRGTYTIQGNRLLLDHPYFQSGTGVRILDHVNGTPVLWRSDGWEAWSRNRKVHPYGVMIRSGRALLPFLPPRRPSVAAISSP
jgi:hypothetical protein